MDSSRQRIPAFALWLMGVIGPASAGSLPPLSPMTAADSVLVIAPHPDDESLCCGGLIHMARRAGARVAIVWVTNGDGSRWDAMLTHRALEKDVDRATSRIERAAPAMS